MKILKQEAQFEEVKIGDYVQLLEDYLLIKSGLVGEVVAFGKGGNTGRIKVKFPMVFVGQIGNSKPRKDDRFIYADPSELKLIKKGLSPSKD